MASSPVLAAGVQDSLRTRVDSVVVDTSVPVFLADDTEVSAWPNLVNAGSSEFGPVWGLPEALEEVTGTLTPELSRLSGAPLVRVLDARRTVVTINGVPLGHSGLRDGSSPIPFSVIEPGATRLLEVLRGPTIRGAGANALAGAIHISSTPDGQSAGTGQSALSDVTVSQRLSSADRGWSGGATAGGTLGRVHYGVGGSARLLGDLRLGAGDLGDAALQPNTSLRESTLRGTFGIDAGRNWQVAGGLISSWREGQSFVDDLEKLRLSKATGGIAIFDPLQFTLAYATSTVSNLGPLDVLESAVWYNAYRESRTFRRATWDRVVFDDDRLATVGLRSTARLRPIGAHSIVLEADARLEGAEAVRWEVRDDQTVWWQRGRFPVGTRSVVTALGVHHDWQINGGLLASAGVRYSARTIRSDYGPSLFGLTGYVGLVDRAYDGLSWTAGLSKRWSGGWLLSASMSSGIRAPGLDEGAGNAYWLYGRDVPNPGLEAERANQAEITARRRDERVDVGLSLYRTQYRNLISRDWFEPGPDGMVGTSDDLFRFKNMDPVAVRGAELDAAVRAGSVAGFDTEVSGRLAVHAWSSDVVATPHYLPSAVGRLGSRFSRRLFFVEPFLRFSSAAPAVEYAVAGAVTGDTPRWLTANFRAGGRPVRNLLLGVTLENIGDVRYVEHGSHIQAPGRSVILSASYTF